MCKSNVIYTPFQLRKAAKIQNERAGTIANNKFRPNKKIYKKVRGEEQKGTPSWKSLNRTRASVISRMSQHYYFNFLISRDVCVNNQCLKLTNSVGTDKVHAKSFCLFKHLKQIKFFASAINFTSLWQRIAGSQ